jgi:hypothetical protein
MRAVWAILTAWAITLALASNGCTTQPTQPAGQRNKAVTAVVQTTDTITVNITTTPSTGVAPLKSTLAATVKSSTGAALSSWTWNYGDGINCTGTPTNEAFCGLTVTHTFSAVKTFTISFSVTDTTGATTSVSTTLTTTSKPVAKQCPTANLWSTQPAGTYATLPAWFLATTPVPLTFIQGAADNIYSQTKGVIIPVGSTWLSPVATWSNGTYYTCMALLAQGGTPPYTYTVQNAPPGLTVNAAGNYGGTATTPAVTYKNIIFCVTDAAGTKLCANPRQQQICDLGKSSCTGFGN